MRWKFYDPGDLKEAALHQSIIEAIDDWWREFQSKKDDISGLFSGHGEWDLPDWMQTHLGAVHPSLMWEYGPAVNVKGHRLVITPESDFALRPLTQTVLDRAPKIDGWEFYGYRLPEDVEGAQSSVKGRTGGDLTDIRVRAQCGDNNRIDLVLFSPKTSGPDDEQALNDAFVAVETLLGEECLDEWIGAIEVASMRSRGKPEVGLIPLERLKETIDSVIGSIIDQLPPRPHYEWSADAEWTMWEMEPEECADYPEQVDLFVSKSVNKPFWMAAHQNGAFYSKRFSRCGETFCYVKIDGAEGLNPDGFADKGEIEDALDAALIPHGLGCQIGGGTGLRYSYIDLALTDLDRSIRVVRERLREGKVPRRSWILFFDTDLSAEWIGIYDDTPPQPMTPDGVEGDENDDELV